MPTLSDSDLERSKFDSDKNIKVSQSVGLDQIDTILADNYPNLILEYKDDFSKGFSGWQHQFSGPIATTGFHRTHLTLSPEARHGEYSLMLQTREAASDEAWCRKGMTLPNNVSKIVFGCYFAFHGGHLNQPAKIRFECDTENAAGTRRFFSFAFENYGSSRTEKWQVNTGLSVTFTDVPNSTQKIPYNEGMKPQFNYGVFVIDYANLKYEKIYSNGNEYDCSALDGPSGTDLTNFENGLVNIYAIQNRSNFTESAKLLLEKTFLGYIYQ